MAFPQNLFGAALVDVAANLESAANRAVALGTLGLILSAITGVLGVYLTTTAGIYEKGFVLLLLWLWTGEAVAVYFCWAARRFGDEMRLANQLSHSARYVNAFRWLARCLWALAAAIGYVLLSAAGLFWGPL